MLTQACSDFLDNLTEAEPIEHKRRRVDAVIRRRQQQQRLKQTQDELSVALCVPGTTENRVAEIRARIAALKTELGGTETA
jgi:RecA/RadA recombinase